MPRKLTTKQFIEKATACHGNIYDYSRAEYISTHTKVKIICLNHLEPYEFWQTPASHCQGNGCPKCAGVAHKTTEEFVIEANITHNNKYDYSKTEYINAYTKVCIVCSIDDHGEFWQTPPNHSISGEGCPKCKGIAISKAKTKPYDVFIEQAMLVHGDKYDYSESIYDKSNKKIKIICNKHQDKFEFWQTPSDHLNGYGCPKCGGTGKKNTKEFILEASEKYNNRYDYSKTEYINNKVNVIIICNRHSGPYEFLCTPHAHLTGQGCPRCGHNISEAERDWLDYLQVDEMYRNIVLKHDDKRYKVDAYDPITNTVYEFYGDFWHGNPIKFSNRNEINTIREITFGELYDNTITRYNELISYGYTIISIWETDWKKIKKAQKNVQASK